MDVQEAVWGLAEDKAPGPDGYPPFFFRRYWCIIRRAVVEAVQFYFSHVGMTDDWKATFITLIPKRVDASEPSHYRPISLCTTLYKVVARIMVGRMTSLMPRIISQEQGAFVGGRSISDNILLAQEMMGDLQRASRRRCLMAVKLDMERAHDRIRWDFLRRALESFGFHRVWIDWILGCVQGPSFSILVNGTPSPFFRATMGLRQGCPLSPFLFIICSDVLSRAMHAACGNRELAPYCPAPGARPLSHLLFADDCLLLARARVSDARALQGVLTEYCVMSGQRVNLQKSTIFFSPSTEGRVRREIRATLGIQEQTGALVYLGVPITGRRLRVAECSTLLERVRSRLEGWRASSLSMMGRLTLIRSVLCSMPIYLMAHTVVPKTVLVGIERLMRSFLWGSYRGGHGIHLLAWERVCLPLREGGLGVQSLLVRREALLARRAVQLVLEPLGHWSQVMIARYGRAGLEGPAIGRRRRSFMWRDIGRYVPIALAHSRWLIGDGRSVDVMDDPWVDAVPLRLWPTTISIEVGEGLRVSDLLRPGEAEWDGDRLGQLFGEHLVERVRSIPLPRSAGPDARVWSTTPRASVGVGEVARLLQSGSQSGIDCGWVWRFGLHQRVALFLWKVAWERLPTCSVLCRRGMSLSPSCPDCGVEESVDHVLFHCVWARGVWSLTGILGATWSGRDLFLEEVRLWASAPQTRGLAIRVSCTAYQIWLARNARVFGERRLSLLFVMERARAQAAEIVQVDERRNGWRLTSRKRESRWIEVGPPAHDSMASCRGCVEPCQNCNDKKAGWEALAPYPEMGSVDSTILVLSMILLVDLLLLWPLGVAGYCICWIAVASAWIYRKCA
ncbi:uncharacterized protein LOC120105653 [Phoenix dactylifera]|uniref:Uncharacterized protein LOC120105653 n=1 Tax=Phoenix dactylifera TaxID=42345 RepID=A0A8B8ZJ89_PHODC|nr:uncharacterized protein LOC120105653 [Phoenix dactylifera]